MAIDSVLVFVGNLILFNLLIGKISKFKELRLTQGLNSFFKNFSEIFGDDTSTTKDLLRIFEEKFLV